MRVLYTEWKENKAQELEIPTFKICIGTFLVVQWLRLHTSNADGVGSIPGQETKIPHAKQCGQRIKKLKHKNICIDEEYLGKILRRIWSKE